MTNQKKTDYICISKESEGPAPDTLDETLPFEQTEKYKVRIKKKRLTNDMILDYAEAMGYDVRNPEFWKSDNATYLEWSKIPVAKQK